MEKTWRFDLRKGDRFVRWDGRDLEVTTRIEGGDGTVERLPPEEVLGQERFFLDDVAVETEVLEAIARTIGLEAVEALEGQAARRRAFWRHIRRERILERTTRSTDVIPAQLIHMRPEGWVSERMDPSSPGVAVSRWDHVYFRGPLRGALALEFRRELRHSLLAAIEPEGAAPGIFPLLDYGALPGPERRWERGGEKQGEAYFFEEGWLIQVMWNHRGQRPKGGRLEHPVEALFTGHLERAPVPAEELEEILEAARLEP